MALAKSSSATERHKEAPRRATSQDSCDTSSWTPKDLPVHSLHLASPAIGIVPRRPLAPAWKAPRCILRLGDLAGRRPTGVFKDTAEPPKSAAPLSECCPYIHHRRKEDASPCIFEWGISSQGSTFSIQPHKYVQPPQCTAQRFRRLYPPYCTTRNPGCLTLTTNALADSSLGHNLRLGGGGN